MGASQLSSCPIYWQPVVLYPVVTKTTIGGSVLGHCFSAAQVTQPSDYPIALSSKDFLLFVFPMCTALRFVCYAALTKYFQVQYCVWCITTRRGGQNAIVKTGVDPLPVAAVYVNSW